MILYFYTGLGIPCIFSKITGLLCPGCGTFRMLVALVQLDFTSAYTANPVVFLCLPFFMYLGIKMIVTYLITGFITYSKKDNILMIMLIIGLTLWGVVRNLN